VFLFGFDLVWEKNTHTHTRTDPHHAMTQIDTEEPQLMAMHQQRLENYKNWRLNKQQYKKKHANRVNVSLFDTNDVVALAKWWNGVLVDGRRGKRCNLYLHGEVNLQKTAFLNVIKETFNMYTIPNDKQWYVSFVPVLFVCGVWVWVGTQIKQSAHVHTHTHS